jgi:murein DD-endopeptidase MepM/ murein hydrolase activator NlpD
MKDPFQQSGLTRSFFWNRRLISPPQTGEMPAGDKMGVEDPAASGLKASFLERAWSWIHATFPERQIYIRSNGRVQFFTFGASLQATLAGLTLIFLGWVAFATVNVIFKDRIIAAKDHRYQQMQAAYEERVADLQMSYDELNGALVSAQDRFKATADALAAKQNAIAGFLNRADQVENSVGARAPQAPGTPGIANMQGSDAGSSALIVMPGPVQPQPRTGRTTRASMLDHAMQRFAALFQSVTQSVHITTHPLEPSPATYAQHPGLKVLAEQTRRVVGIGGSETQMMAKTEGELGRGIGAVQNIMRRAGINPDLFLRKAAAGEGVGGPEIPLDQVRIEGISDPKFNHAYFSAAARLDQLNGLSAALDHVPLTMPVSAGTFDKSSGFGARTDPFTGRFAFHPGIDFAGPWGSVVHATAPGTVVFAGNRGGYGNMVEIDHGYGIHTRYGHLSAISVKVGTYLAKGAGLGRVGSTGRSTGPHVHYEVWYDDVVKNPNNFIEAGRHVL